MAKKKHGLLDKVLHGSDREEESDHEDHGRPDPDLIDATDPEYKPEVTSAQGGKHDHKKFDKFKRGI